MDIRAYDIMFVFCNLINTYVIYRLMIQFLDERKSTRRTEILSYVCYYFLMLLCYFVISIPIVMLLYNMVSFFLLSLNYSCTLKNRIFICAFLLCVLFLTELLSAAITGYIHFPLDGDMDYSSILGLAINLILSLTFVNLLRPYKNKSRLSVPFAYWIGIILMPIFSIYFLVVLLDAGGIDRGKVLFVIFVLLGMNFTVIYLYDFILKTMDDRTNRLLVEQQNKYYLNQLGMMENMIKSDRAFRHDLKNHLLSLDSYLRNEDNEGALAYMEQMRQFEQNCKNNFSVSDNSVIDSIINLKLQEAKKKGIQIVSKICIPQNLAWNSFDATILLCNILDNATEAAGKAKEKQITIRLDYNRNRLILKVRNTYDGEIEIRNGAVVTRKTDKLSHGIGLQNIYSVVEKYDGIVKTDYDGEWFEIDVMLYV